MKLTKGLDKVRKENLRLRKAIERDAIELKRKNRELKIESALEKVRAVAMKMKKATDMLDICKSISLQLQSLGVKEIRNVQTAIFDVHRSSYMNYEYYAKHHKAIVTDVDYSKNRLHKTFALNMLKGKGGNWVTHIKGVKKVKDWVKYQKTTNVFIDKYLYKASSLNYYWHSLGPVALGMSTYLPLSKDDLNLFHRFLNVFGLAFQKYLEIEKAQTRVREAQIETSLEKVRAAAMGMHKSADLLNVCQVLFKELRSLGFDEMRNAMINIHNDKEKSFVNYDYSDEIGKSENKLFYSIHPLVAKQIKKIRSANDAFSETFFTGKDLTEWKKFRKRIGEKDDPRLNKNNGLYYYFYSIGIGSIGISTFGVITDQKKALLKRFRNVFALSYQRYVDVTNAEAQAKESLIQLALERIRARTMAMQKSDELKEVTEVLFQQFKSLGATTAQVSICVFDEGLKTGEMFVTLNGEKIDRSFIMELDKETFVVKKVKKKFLEKEKKFAFAFKGKELQNYNRWRNSMLGTKAWDESAAVRTQSWYVNIVLFSRGMLGISSDSQPSEEALNLLERFTKVFDLTFTRFLDLKNAEAQTKEAQIEAALEKVRGSAMAMHDSNDIAITTSVVFTELRKLGIESLRCGVVLPSKDSKMAPVYAAAKSSNGEYLTLRRTIDMREHFGLVKQYESWMKQENYVAVLSGKTLRSYYNLPFFHSSSSYKPPARFDHNEYGYYIPFADGLFYAWTEKVYSAGELNILNRFKAIIGLTFRRFFDLQKSEAQTREAEIQLALERVRARTMAMQHSDELKSAATLLFQQVKALGVPAYSCGYNIWERGEKEFTSWMSTQDGTDINAVPHIPLTEDQNFIRFAESKKKGESFFVLELRGKRMQEHYRYLKTIPAFKAYFDYAISVGFDLPETQIHHIANFSQGNLLFITLEPCPEFHEVFKRFAAVFEQTYTRFLDLQKSEAQARESQIELALERVRAKTMAMQKSDELKDVIQVVYNQFGHLNIRVDHTGFVMDYKARDDHNIWIADNIGAPSEVTIPDFDCEYYNRFNEAKRKGLDFFPTNLNFDEKNQFYHELFKHVSGLPEESKKFLLSCPGLAASTVLLENVGLYIENFSGIPYTDEENNTLMRFGKVFQQTYTRFLDLQKAEAQAREAQIDASLERVRAKTMAMHSSDEVSSATATMFTELEKLGIENLRGGIASFKNDLTQEVWSVNNLVDGKTVTAVGLFDLNAHPFWRAMYSEWKKKKDFFYYYLSGKEKKDYIRLLNASPNYLSQPIKEFPDIHFQIYYFTEGALWANSMKTHSEEDKQVMKRFASVFSLTFRRYQDLKKAEAQAREAQIEAALERVRSRTMAMQKSDELMETSFVLFQQFRDLGITGDQNSIGIFNEEKGIVELFTTVYGNKIEKVYEIPFDEPIIMETIVEAWRSGIKSTAVDISGERLNAYNTWRNTLNKRSLFKVDNRADDHWIAQPAFFSSGFLSIATKERLTPESINILERFAGVFDLTYTRFNDLKKAEAQRREAEIELALERVRSKAMAMHSSEDLASTVNLFFSELQVLRVTPRRCGVSLVDEETKIAHFFATSATEGGVSKEMKGELKLAGHPVLDAAFQGWKTQQEYHPMLVGNEIREYYKVMNPQVEFPEFLEDEKQFGYYLYFKEGFVFAWREKELNDEEIQIFRKFTSVLSLTYRRYMDLKEAESQAREAQIEAALERVRSRTLAMQRSDELAETAAVLFRQLINLGIEPNRLYINIINDEVGNAEFWITDEDGTKVASAFEINLGANDTFKKMLNGWKENNKSIVIDMQGNELQEYFKYLSSIHVPFKGGLEQKRRVQHLAYFGKGFIGMASPEPQPEETIQLLERFAAVFNLTYTRFNDLKVAEAHALQAEEDLVKLQTEKKRAEEALTELRSTQAQLIQSEKMASLGELTAGIAHEIQNPLNFVNNFSEVSSELIDEMKEELQKGNTNDAITIANDLKLNLEKVLHHGKRADGIVKGMLQHSRTGSGQKELTDINALADEYLRLAYHGLRAKDKTFNAKFELQGDPSLEKINIVPQDIGRVILNLITNAFHAVSEKKRQQPSSYEPTVTVATKIFTSSSTNSRNVEIKVMDNGTGIPQRVRDKIFQPFFTTKPTGQGTGLGLSLSYDIIKAHGGEITVNSIEGEGTEFVIQLPV